MGFAMRDQPVLASDTSRFFFECRARRKPLDNCDLGTRLWPFIKQPSETAADTEVARELTRAPELRLSPFRSQDRHLGGSHLLPILRVKHHSFSAVRI